MRTSRATLLQQFLTLTIIFFATHVAFAVHAVHGLHQTSEPAPVAFEVALVRTSTAGAERSVSRMTDASYAVTNVTLRSLIADTYLIRPSRVIGGPEWLDSDRFDIEARAPRGTPRSVYLPMLKTLLADRFRLVLHAEQREQSIHALARADNNAELGSNLRHSSPECPPVTRRRHASVRGECGVRVSVNGRKATIEGHGLSMIEIADALSDVGFGPLIDRTGLPGAFDFELRFTQETFATAVLQQLGLTLEPIRYPIQYLVIDSVQRPTPE